MDEVEDSDKKAPLVKIDDTYIEKAKPEVLMEMMFDKIKDSGDKNK